MCYGCDASDMDMLDDGCSSSCKGGVFGYKVNIERRCIHDERESGEWGSYNIQYDNSFESIASEDKYPDITAPFALTSTETAYLVWAEWSTGDSFGSSDCGCAEAFGLFKDRAAAEELAKAIRAFKKDTDTQHSYQFACETSDGQKFSCYAPWVGYFENLESVYVEAVSLSSGKKRY